MSSPDVDTFLIASSVVRLSAGPHREIHETVRPQLSRFRGNARSDLLCRRVQLPVPDAESLMH